MANIAYSVSIEDRIKKASMCLEALRNIIKNSPGVETQCIGYFPILFGLLNVSQQPGIQKGAIDVINAVTRNQDCVNDIAASEVLANLLLLLYSLPDQQTTILDSLYALMSTTKIVREALNKGKLPIYY